MKPNNVINLKCVFRLIAVVQTIALLGLNIHSPAHGQDAAKVAQKRNDDTALLTGLRQRRLFESAEFYCKDQLAKPNLDATTQATLVIELMKTQTAQAIFSPVSQRASVWETTQKTSEDFLANNQDHPRRFLIEVQSALSRISRAKLLAQEIAADIAGAQAKSIALDSLSQSQNQLRRLQKEITEQIPKQLKRKLNDDELTSEQLLTLNNNIRFQLAVCNLNRAQLYEPNDRLNRVDALTEVMERLIEVQRETSLGQPLWWETKLGMVECFRLMGKTQEAYDALADLPTKDIPIDTANSLLEQKVRLAVAMQNAKFSQRVMKEVQKKQSSPAQLDLAIVELAISQSRTAQSDKLKEEWISFAAARASQIEKSHGPYWARRANLVLINSVGNPNGTPNTTNPPVGSGTAGLDLLIRIADEAFRKQQFDDALRGYDQATQKAISLGANDQALQMDIRASQIFEKQSKFELAATRLIDAAKRDPKIKLAAAAHHRGCWNYSRLLAANKPKRTSQYRGYLDQHLKTWPNEPSSDQVRIWLGGQLQNQKQWMQAIDTYLDVSNTSPHLGSAIAQLHWCAKMILREQSSVGQSTYKTVNALIGKLDKKQKTLAESDPAWMKIFLTRVELDLIFGSKKLNPKLSESLSVIEASDDAALSKRALAIHVVSISLESPEQSKRLLDQIKEDETALDVCDRCLSAVITQSANGNNEQLNTLRSLRLTTIDFALRIPETEASKKTRTSWLFRKSKTLLGLSRHVEAVSVLESLEQKYPRSAAVKIELARALTNAMAKSDPDKPLAKWRSIAGRVKSHTPNWFEAKYNVAELLLGSGKKDDAAKLLKFIKAIPPGWEKSAWKPKFETLLKRCE